MSEEDRVIKHYLDRLKAHYTPPSVGQRAKMVSYALTYTRMTQTELAKRVGCSQSIINRLLYLSENASDEEWVMIHDRDYPVSYAFKFVKDRRENNP